MKFAWEVLLGAAVVAGSILFIGRYEISGIGYGYATAYGGTTMTAVYRLDRWTGKVEVCMESGFNGGGEITVDCPASAKKSN